MDKAVPVAPSPSTEAPDSEGGAGASPKRCLLIRFFDPLGPRLTLLLTLALLPSAIGGAVFALRAYDQQVVQVSEAVDQFAQLAASHERNFFKNTWRLLTGLTRNLGANDMAQGCPRAFTTFLGIYPEYGALTLVDGQGIVVCTLGVPQDSARSVSVTTAPWYRRLRLLQDFIIGNYRLSDKNDREWVAAMPVFGEDGKIVGAAALTFKLDRLADFLQASGLPAAGVLYALDRHGTVLFSRGASGGLGGLPSKVTVRKVAGDEALEFQARDRSGLIRAYSVVVLQGGALHVLFGLPVTDIFGWINQGLCGRVTWLFGTCLAAVLASYLAAHLLVTRWLRRLRDTVADYAAGRLESLPSLEQAPFEFRDLGASFATMAQRVARREAEFHQIIREKDLLIREIHHRVKNNMQTVLSLNTLLLGRQRDPAAITALSDLENRVTSLALVQRHLDLDHSTALINTGNLVKELVSALIDSRRSGQARLALTIDWPSLPFSQDQAVPLALIVTELVTNSLRHAFPAGRGTLILRARVEVDKVVMVFSDDGHGFDPKRPRGLGLTLLPGLAKQLGVAWTLDTGHGRGTTWTLVMPRLQAGRCSNDDLT